ncbi:baseplate J/gp47 family protein [Anaerophilus nitritogenes]|uniref:baseplate J/gp47 family protein n=1 Tax=Anaerophilus nitritogenes TaxID=2498136 RepID=UPI00101CA4BF|nr:baseplate J/gp47 family protein [Anaerophilus nitritogenes]
MFVSKDKDTLKDEMLDDIDDTEDKTSGGFIYKVIKAIAIAISNLYKYTKKEVVEKLDVENLHSEELERYIKQRTGITRKQATYAVGEIDIEGNGTVYEGDLFQTENGLQFKSTETKTIVGKGIVKIQATKAGEISVVPAGVITKMPMTLEGITNVNNSKPTIDGYEAETDESLLERYYERIRTPATSGNKAHYKNWAKEVEGVGDARVFPLWQGDNTVKVVIIDANKQPASTELVANVQEHIDPNKSGLGEGTAPIGAYCTVSSTVAKQINISVKINRISDSYSIENIKEKMKTNISEYLKSIAFKQNYVSHAAIGNIIFNTEGVADHSDLKVNNSIGNIAIVDEEVAILGGVSIA